MTDENNTTASDIRLLANAVWNNLRDRLKNQIGLVLLVPLVLVGVMALNYYYQYQLFKNDPQKAAEIENRKLVSAISAFVDLPQGEDPTVATVSNPDLLKDQPFFAKAQKGYKVLIYSNARRAILYNPDTQKVVDMVPLNINNPAPTPVPSPAKK